MPALRYAGSFHVDHIVARQHGGETARENLALSCLHCNYRKGPQHRREEPGNRRNRPAFSSETRSVGRPFRYLRSTIPAFVLFALRSGTRGSASGIEVPFTGMRLLALMERRRFRLMPLKICGARASARRFRTRRNLRNTAEIGSSIRLAEARRQGGSPGPTTPRRKTKQYWAETPAGHRNYRIEILRSAVRSASEMPECAGMSARVLSRRR
jgi:hypothetical protein